MIQIKKYIRVLLLPLVLVVFVGFDLFAGGPPVGGPGNGPGGGGPGPPGGCWPPSQCIPIDGGLSFLLLAGAAYGAKKIIDNSKKDAE